MPRKQHVAHSTLLKKLLECNLFGVDIDEHAVRVASFSLYLTMCDEIDPKSYLKNTKFPRLRASRLICADFFREDAAGFSAERDGPRPTYDCVVGNATWGKDTATELARQWSANQLLSELLSDFFCHHLVMVIVAGGE